MMGFLYEERLVLIVMLQELVNVRRISLLYVGTYLLNLQCAEGQITSAKNMRPVAYM